MTKEELIDRLREIAKSGAPGYGYTDEEVDHLAADQALLDYINDPDVAEAFNSIKKWYA